MAPSLASMRCCSTSQRRP